MAKKTAAPTTAPRRFSIEIAPDLFLIQQEVDHGVRGVRPTVRPPTHHIATIDCSGSMQTDLPQLRNQLKTKLLTLLGPQDILSLVWFSGRGQCGVVFDGVGVPTLAKLQEIQAVIDRWLVPVGMTGFKEPLALIPGLIERNAQIAPGRIEEYAVNLLFMSDGMDNQWPKHEILAAAGAIGQRVQAATVVEYGYYADRALLTTLATTFGGALVFAEDFERYAPSFEAALRRAPAPVPASLVVLDDITVVGGFVFAIDREARTVRTFATDAAGNAFVPAEVKEIFALAGTAVGPVDRMGERDPAPLYAALGLFAHRMHAPAVAALLRRLGDVRLIDAYATCFGKARYSAFVEDATVAAFDATQRLVGGYDPTRVPHDDAPTALDVLHLLAEDETATLRLDDPAFRYNRIGRKALDASEHLYVAEREILAGLQAKLIGETNAAKIAAVNADIATLLANKGTALKFVPDPAPNGYSIANLTWNSARPNVSVLIHKTGTVDLSGFPECPKMPDGATPDGVQVGVVPTSIWRNYTIVKDGLIHVQTLPVKMAAATYAKLHALIGNNVVLEQGGGGFTGDNPVRALVLLGALPILNRRAAAPPTAEAFFDAHVALLRAKAAQKVYNWYAKERLPSRRADGLAARYGADAAAWMLGRGLRDDGFSPKTTDAPATDLYLAKYLDVKIKGYSSLPSVPELLARRKSGKPLNGPARMMLPTVDEVEAFLDSAFMKKAGYPTAVLAAWLETQQKNAVQETRAWLAVAAQTAFAMIVGQTWLAGKTLDETAFEVSIDGESVPCSVEMLEEEIKI